jgi:hypothetical protein
VLTCLVGGGGAYADQGLAIGAGGGTIGAGVDATAQITPALQLRAGFNGLSYNLSETLDDVSYRGALELTSWSVFIDLRPFSNSFILSLGSIMGEKGLQVKAMPTSNVTIGNQTYTPAQVGALSLDVDLDDNAPFLGVGWDTTFQSDSPLGLRLTAGAMMSGSPAIALSASGGGLSSDQAFLAEIEREEENLQADLKSYRLYPVLQAAATIRF